MAPTPSPDMPVTKGTDSLRAHFDTIERRNARLLWWVAAFIAVDTLANLAIAFAALRLAGVVE